MITNSQIWMLTKAEWIQNGKYSFHPGYDQRDCVCDSRLFCFRRLFGNPRKTKCIMIMPATITGSKVHGVGYRTFLLSQACNIRIIGSVARHEAHDKSDIDLLVEFAPTVSLLPHAAFQRELTVILGRAVDVASVHGLKDKVRRSVIRMQFRYEIL